MIVSPMVATTYDMFLNILGVHSGEKNIFLSVNPYAVMT